MAKILVVEDDIELAERLDDWFKLENHIVEVVGSGEDALQMLSVYSYDVVVLDWGLPGMNGIDVCKQYRRSGGHTPIIFLTGKDDVESKMTGLDCGADDYLPKPFDVRELSARIRSLTRRPTTMLPADISMGDVRLDPVSRTVQVGDKSVHLMPREAALLEYLMRHPNRHFGARALLEAVWPSDTEASEDTVRTVVKTLRRQLASIGRDDLVKTQLGSGYFIEYIK
jgi:DNA-binding response OmpR family regulator